MPRVPIPLGQNYGKGRSNAAGLSQAVNMYGEEVVKDGRTNWVLYPTPGEVLFASIGGSAPRGQFTAGSISYAVVGTSLYSVTTLGSVATLGTIEGSLPVDMFFNGAQLTVVAELKSYSYDQTSNVLSEISDPNFERASSGDSLASYDIFAVAGTGKIRWRLVNTATFNANDFATAEAEPDNLRAVRKVGNEVALLGYTSTEWWYPTGDSSPGNQFAKTSTAAVSIGCDARDTALVLDSGLTWVGRDGKAGGRAVYRAQGYSPRKISIPQIDVLLEQVSDPTRLNAFARQEAGHLYYVLNNPGEWSFEWDISTNQWYPRKSGSFSIFDDVTGGWDATTFTVNGSKQIIGKSDGNLYELQTGTYTADGEYIHREVTSPTIHNSGRRGFMGNLELDIETSVALESGQGSNPLMVMSYSKNGGKSWSQPRTAEMGVVGQHKYRCRWPGQLGSFRQLIIRFHCSEPVKVVILGCWADLNWGGA